MAARRKSVAGPWGGALLDQVRSRLSEGWPDGLTTMTGDDLYHLDRAQELLLDRLAPDRKDGFTLTVLSDGKRRIEEVVSAASSMGMFSPSRVVLVRDVSVLEGDPAALDAFVESPPSRAFLIVRAPKLDRKRKLHQSLTRGTLLAFRPPETPAERSALLAEVVSMGKGRGQLLDRDGASLLLEACRGDLLRVEMEMDRLRDWAGESPHRWSRRELESNLGTSAVVTGWEVGDALVRRDRAEALAAIRRVIEAGSDPIPVVGGLAWRARVFLTALARIAAGEPAETVAKTSGAWGWSEAMTLGLRRWTLHDALRIPERLLLADRQLKSRGLPGPAVLESIVEDLMPPRPEVRR
jgi:DNA polymerase III delta subunit